MNQNPNYIPSALVICCDFIGVVAAGLRKRGGKGQGWVCSKNPPFLLGRSITTGANPVQSQGAARTCLKPTCAPVPPPLPRDPYHPQQRKHCKSHFMGTGSGDNRRLQQKSSPESYCLAIKSWRTHNYGTWSHGACKSGDP